MTTCRFRFYVAVFSTGILLSSSARATNTSIHTFTYQGQLTDGTGTNPLLDIVSIEISILSPSGGGCLLYDEMQSGINLTTTNGLFAIQIGSDVGDAKRTASDPGLTMQQVFANTGSVAASTPYCPSGYTPAADDGRQLEFIITPSSGISVTLSPDQLIASVPYAQVAESIQGIIPANLIQVNSANNLSQATAETLTNGSDASALHTHDSLYLKANDSTAQNVGSGGLYTAGALGVGTSSATSGTQVQVDASAATSKGLVVQAASGQTAQSL